jgi:hypothetical protein
MSRVQILEYKYIYMIDTALLLAFLFGFLITSTLLLTEVCVSRVEILDYIYI